MLGNPQSDHCWVNSRPAGGFDCYPSSPSPPHPPSPAFFLVQLPSPLLPPPHLSIIPAASPLLMRVIFFSAADRRVLLPPRLFISCSESPCNKCSYREHTAPSAIGKFHLSFVAYCVDAIIRDYLLATANFQYCFPKYCLVGVASQIILPGHLHL